MNHADLRNTYPDEPVHYYTADDVQREVEKVALRLTLLWFAVFVALAMLEVTR